MMALIDLGHFGQWLVAHHDRVSTDLLQEQQRSQEDLLKTLCGHLQQAALRQAAALGAPVAAGSYFHLAKFMAEDDVEAFPTAFESTAAVAAWPRGQ